MDERKAGSWIEFGKILFFAKLTKRLLGGARINFNEGQGVVGKVTRGPNCVVIFITSEEFRLRVDFTKVRALALEHLSLSSLSRSRPYTPPPSGIQPSFRKDPLHSSFHRSVFASPSTHIDVARRDVPDWRFRWGEGGGWRGSGAWSLADAWLVGSGRQDAAMLL